MRPTVLVVDDQPLTLRLFARILTLAGYDVRTAADGEEALALIATQPPALVLTDLQLPGLPGKDLVAQVQREHPQIRLIVTSALGSGDAIPGVPYLAKPFSQAQLLALMREILPLATNHERG